MPDDFPSRSLDKVIVRLPEGMRDRLKAEAEANKRSMNAEIVARLENPVRTDAGYKEIQDLKGIISDLAKHLGKDLLYRQAVSNLLQNATMDILAEKDVDARSLVMKISEVGIRISEIKDDEIFDILKSAAETGDGGAPEINS